MKVLYIGNKLSMHGFTPTSIEYLGNSLELNGVEVIYASDKRNVMSRITEMLISIVVNRKVDVVLIDTYSSTAFIFALLSGMTAMILGIRYVPIVHGGNFKERLSKTPRLVRLLFRNSARVVTVSRYLQQVLKEYDTLYIPNTIELSMYPLKCRSAILPRLLWVRSLHSIYNPSLALEIVAALKTQDPSVTLAMVGPDKDGSLEILKSKVAILGLENHVTFYGKLSKPDWIRLSESFDIFINTTNFDNMPVSVVEAMALGLPVVSTNVGGMPFLIDHEKDGLLVMPDDAAGFVTEIRRLIQHPELAVELARSARQKVEGFDAGLVIKQWKDLINEIVQRHS